MRRRDRARAGRFAHDYGLATCGSSRRSVAFAARRRNGTRPRGPGGKPRMRRVVVTGLGMLTPLGCGVEPTWKRLLAGESGARKIEHFDVSDIPCKIAMQIPRGDGSDGTFNPDQWMKPKEQRKVDHFIVYAMCAARQALDDAGWHPQSYVDQTRTGVVIGSGIGGIGGI